MLSVVAQRATHRAAARNVNAKVGYCARTSSGAGDCLSGDMGAFILTRQEVDRSVQDSCIRRCEACARCLFASWSHQWRDCSWFSSCKLQQLHTDVPAFFSARMRHKPGAALMPHLTNGLAKLALPQCGHDNECPRNYTAAQVDALAARARLAESANAVRLERRRERAKAECKRSDDHRWLASGGWCLGKPIAVPKGSAGLTQELPLGHVVADQGIVTFLLVRLLRPDVAGSSAAHAVVPATGAGLYSLNDFGAGVGQYGTELLAWAPALRYRAYDNAGNVEAASGGAVAFFDLSIPLALPRADFVMSLEVGEHVPNERERAVVANLHSHNCRGILLSWGGPGQMGKGHVNNHSPEYITALFDELGYYLDDNATALVRRMALFWWIRPRLLVLMRRQPVC